MTDMTRPVRTRRGRHLALTLTVAVAVTTGGLALPHTDPARAASAPAGTAQEDASPGAGAPAADQGVLPAGPLPTSIETSEDGTSTDVLVHGQGSAAAAQVRENRSYRHSDLQPTGRFVRKGDALTVEVPDGAPATSVRIGLYGRHQGLNGGADTTVGPATATPTGTTTVTASQDGMVYLQSTAEGGSAIVTVAGGEPVPTFVLGQTTDDDFAAQLQALPDAPMFEIVGERIFADLQARLRPHVQHDLTTRVTEWDDVVEITNHMHGLLDDATGSAAKSSHRVHVADPDSAGSGVFASAGSDRLNFPVSSGAGRTILASPRWDQWGLWHELGHTYQTPAYNWGGQGEVAVNISALEVQLQKGWTSRLDRMQGEFATFFSKPVDERRYAQGGLWARLLMYDQLRRSFGPEFYPRLNQELRVMTTLGELQPRSDADKIDAFALTSARLADRDLTEFFRQWGLSVSPSVREAMSKLPPLEHAIWENRIEAEAEIENLLPAVGTPVGRVVDPGPVALGQRTLPTAPVVEELGSTDGGTVTVGAHHVQALDPGRGQVHVELVDARGQREVVSATVPVSLGEALRAEGRDDRVVMWVSLVPAEGRLALLPRTTYAAHSSWAGSEYVGVELRSPDDAEALGTWSVRGDQNAHGVLAGVDQHYEDGQILVVRHREARTRLERYADGTLVPARAATTQRFRIVGDRLIDLSDPVADGGLAAAPSEPVVLLPGETGLVPVAIKATANLTSIRQAVTLTAPAGTTFARGQAVEGQRDDGDGWRTVDSLALSDVEVSADGSELTGTFDSAATPDFSLTWGQQLRWLAPVTANG